MQDIVPETVKDTKKDSETDENQAAENGGVSRGGALAGLYDWISAAVFALVLVTLVFSFWFRIVEVDGNSMNPTLLDTERLITNRLCYTPERGDIVIVNLRTREPLVKRVIALGGDTLRIDDETNTVYINGEALDEPYIQGRTISLGFGTEERVIPDGYVFVMGDNREDSTDSRFMNQVGYVKQSDLIGEAVYRFFPLSRAGGLQ